MSSIGTPLISEKKLFGIKSKISHAILHENPTQARRLDAVLSRLYTDGRRREHACDQATRTFAAHQVQKCQVWKREDQARIGQMNLPARLSGHDTIHIQTQVLRDLPVLYRAPHYNLVTHNFKLKGPVIPVSNAVDESISIVAWDNKIFVQRVKKHLKIKKSQMAQHDLYCGKETMETASCDNRFLGLEEILSPVGGSLRVSMTPSTTSTLSRSFQEDYSGSNNHHHKEENAQKEIVKARETITVSLPQICDTNISASNASNMKHLPSLKKSMTIHLPLINNKPDLHLKSTAEQQE